MKVKELIKELKKFPQDFEVLMEGSDSYEGATKKIETLNIILK